MDTNFFNQIQTQLDPVLGNHYVQVLIVIVITLMVQYLSRPFIERLTRRIIRKSKYESRSDEQKREDTVIEIFRTSFVVIIWPIALLTILAILDVNIAGLLTGAGLLGVVIGLGAQTTIKDIIAGIFILSENQYRVGDVVTLSGGTTGAVGTSGVVEDISLRITKLRDLDGTLNIVRNGEASIITNRTFKFSSVVVDINVTYDTSIDKVEKLMNEVGITVAGMEQWKSLTVEPIQFFRVEKFTESAVVVRAVGKTAPAAHWDIAGVYRRELLKSFAKYDISIGHAQVIISNQ